MSYAQLLQSSQANGSPQLANIKLAILNKLDDLDGSREDVQDLVRAIYELYTTNINNLARQQINLASSEKEDLRDAYVEQLLGIVPSLESRVWQIVFMLNNLMPSQLLYLLNREGDPQGQSPKIQALVASLPGYISQYLNEALTKESDYNEILGNLSREGKNILALDQDLPYFAAALKFGQQRSQNPQLAQQRPQQFTQVGLQQPSTTSEPLLFPTYSQTVYPTTRFGAQPAIQQQQPQTTEEPLLFPAYSQTVYPKTRFSVPVAIQQQQQPTTTAEPLLFPAYSQTVYPTQQQVLQQQSRYPVTRSNFGAPAAQQ